MIPDPSMTKLCSIATLYPRLIPLTSPSSPEFPSMARVGIIFGLLLCGLTAAAMLGSLQKMPVQFVPMMLGIPLLFCGVVSLNPHRRRIAMNVAVGIASIGAVLGSLRLLYCLTRMARGTDINRYALQVVVVMTVLCIIFVGICIVSMMQAKRRRAESAARLGAARQQ